jgi:hypothetical protein
VPRLFRALLCVLTGCRIGFDAQPRQDTPDPGDGAHGDAGDGGSDTPDAVASCPGYEPLTDLPGTYRIGTMREAWLAAEQACEQDGAHLAVVGSDTENGVLWAKISPTWGTFWIGVTDRVAEGMYVNVTGGAPSYTNWVGPVPSNVSEDCVSMGTGGAAWEDQDCGAAFAWVCECDGAAVASGTY